MPWASARIEMPEEWWDAIRQKEHLPSWFRQLVKWATSLRTTHVHTQTFRAGISGWEAQSRYCRFLAEHSSRWMLKAVLWAVEQHPGGHGSHIHALWKTPFDTYAESCSATALYRLVKAAGNNSMGFSRLWPIVDGHAQAAAYCLKYILKGLKALEAKRMPAPSDPMEREKLWGLWTPPSQKRSPSASTAATTQARGLSARSSNQGGSS